jgi:hypothetical protein
MIFFHCGPERYLNTETFPHDLALCQVVAILFRHDKGQDLKSGDISAGVD